MQMDIAVTGGAPGNPKHLFSPWDGLLGGSSAPAATDLSAVSGTGKGSITPLAGGATYQTATQLASSPISGGIGAAFFTAEVYADQNGTLFVERNVGGTWYPVNGLAGQAYALGTSVVVKTPVTTATGYRARFVNGATPNTVFALTTAYTLN